MHLLLCLIKLKSYKILINICPCQYQIIHHQKLAKFWLRECHRPKTTSLQALILLIQQVANHFTITMVIIPSFLLDFAFLLYHLPFPLLYFNFFIIYNKQNLINLKTIIKKQIKKIKKFLLCNFYFFYFVMSS